ncbi:MAG: Cysteine--tRNA ligase [Microgenomates bacterium OLB22]|nr:MAG: Cysteine--tRNA ligase [Microgenomates bacterium OLB22]
MRIYNTATRLIEDFTPLNGPKVTFYACGFTSYDFAHIGHARKYTNDDVLKRALTHFGYDVNHVMNITDVGHLVSDGDEGDDKIAKGATKYGKTVDEVATFFTDDFLSMIDHMGIIRPDHIPHATDHIAEMITLIQRLLDKGHAYITQEAIYFDVTTFASYGKLGGQALEDKKTAVREEVVAGTQKRNPADFSLWFFRVGRFANHAMHWDSPWGDGFPGWHIECSAMSMKYLGETIDIHSGGIDLIPVHHEDEIAQSEAATGKPFVKYWFHSYFLMVDGTKMSKSLGNFLRLKDIEDNGYSPMSLRYLFLQAHYRSEMNFTWESLQGADTAYKKLLSIVRQLKAETQRLSLSPEKLQKTAVYMRRFDEAIANDLQMPQALAIVWEVIKSNVPAEDKLDFLLEADRVLGLGLSDLTDIPHDPIAPLPPDIQQLKYIRDQARADGNYARSDELRKALEEAGYEVSDTATGTVVTKTS